MKCDDCMTEAKCIHIGYGICLCPACLKKDGPFKKNEVNPFATEPDSCDCCGLFEAESIPESILAPQGDYDRVCLSCRNADKPKNPQ